MDEVALKSVGSCVDVCVVCALELSCANLIFQAQRMRKHTAVIITLGVFCLEAAGVTHCCHNYNTTKVQAPHVAHAELHWGAGGGLLISRNA